MSHSSNVGMSWSKDVVRSICHCVVHRVSLYCCIAVYMGSCTGLQGKHGCNITARCCSFSVRCASSSTCAGGFMVGPTWLSLSWSYWKHSCYCSRSLWGLVSSLYPVAVLLSRSSMLWVVGVVSRVAVLWGQAFPQHHHTWQFDPHMFLSCCEFCGIFCNGGAGLWKTTVHSCGTSVCRSMLMLRMRKKKPLTRQRLCWSWWGAFWVLLLNPVSW